MDLKRWLEMLVKCQNPDKTKEIQMFINILVQSTRKRLTEKKENIFKNN